MPGVCCLCGEVREVAQYTRGRHQCLFCDNCDEDVAAYDGIHCPHCRAVIIYDIIQRLPWEAHNNNVLQIGRTNRWVWRAFDRYVVVGDGIEIKVDDALRFFHRPFADWIRIGEHPFVCDGIAYFSFIGDYWVVADLRELERHFAQERADRIELAREAHRAPIVARAMLEAMYRPGGPGALRAQAHFEALVASN